MCFSSARRPSVYQWPTHFKKHALAVSEASIQRESAIPASMKHYMSFTFRPVSKSLPKAGQLCNTYRPHISTADMRKAVAKPPSCSCSHMREMYGVRLVHGHCFTRSFDWKGSQLPTTSDPCIVHQNLKNGLLPLR